MLLSLLCLQRINLNFSLSIRKLPCQGDRLGILPVLAMVVLMYECMLKQVSQVGRQLAAFWPFRKACVLDSSMSRNALRSSLASGIRMYSSIARECKAFRG